MKTNHYGITIDSDIPITGVLSTGDINFEWLDSDICLTCDEIVADIENDESLTDDEREDEIYNVSCEYGHTRLLGDWKQDENGKYFPDESGEFSAIENESSVQVVWSKFTTHAKLCSPCYPGQADIPSDGPWLAYTLPEYLTSRD